MQISFFIFIFMLNSCGYKPMAYFANKALGDKVCVKMYPNLENPEESIRIKDTINEAIYSRFHSQVVDESEADSILNIDVQNIKDAIIATNSQGFATFYRVYVTIRYTFTHNDKTFSYVNPGYYDYAASLTSPLTTYNNRSVAIIEAAKQSLDRFISQVGYSASF
ncbi:LPS assembly lipoprotein LptE [Helicobacter saguini]|nr:LPS assembly lipoprotein LptE [Helicobacter saguini]